MIFHVVMNCDFCDDESYYTQDLKNFTSYDIVVRCVEKRVWPQLTAFLSWRNRQTDVFSVHLYHTHFHGKFTPFVPLPEQEALFEAAPMWSRKPNLWERRHQAFLEWKSDNPMFLWADNVVMYDLFDCVEDIKQCCDGGVDLVSYLSGTRETGQVNRRGVWVAF